MTPPIPHLRVLSTLKADGSRNWLQPRLARGRFQRRRKVVGYGLIALFVALPFIRIGGRPALLLDVLTRELSVFGAVFRPSDGVVLMLVGIAIVVAVFFVTALFGRVWCGWGCPQTVYLEHVFRPIERWLGGPRNRRATPARRVAKWAIYAALSFVIANVFLAYFVGIDRLVTWVFESPSAHAGGFALVMAVSGLMLFDFGYFREQMCIVTCPYGRLQSVLLDRQSLIVGYDARRGEPRGKPKQAAGGRGDCVDCGACVDVCPTGIDIRDGLQMECIGCAQCADACDAVMTKLHRPAKLIGYTSQDELASKPRRIWRARTVIYPALLAVAFGVLVLGAHRRGSAQVWVGRATGASFVDLPDGGVSSQVRLRIENDSDDAHRYTATLVDAPDAALRGQATWTIQAGRALEISVFVDVPRATFSHGARPLEVRVDDDGSFTRTVQVSLLGPDGGAR